MYYGYLMHYLSSSVLFIYARLHGFKSVLPNKHRLVTARHVFCSHLSVVLLQRFDVIIRKIQLGNSDLKL